MDALGPVPAIARFDLVLEHVQVARALGVLIDQCPHVGQAVGDGIEHRGAVRQVGLLRDMGDAQSLLRLARAIVGALQVGQNFQQRRLAGAVAPDQANSLLRFEGEIRVVQECHMAVRQLCALQGDQRHAVEFRGAVCVGTAGAGCGSGYAW